MIKTISYRRRPLRREQVPPKTATRHAIEWQIPDAATLHTFVIEHLPDLANDFPYQLERREQENWLLRRVPTDQLLAKLEVWRRHQERQARSMSHRAPFSL